MYACATKHKHWVLQKSALQYKKYISNNTIQFRFKMKRYEWVVKGRFYRWQQQNIHNFRVFWLVRKQKSQSLNPYLSPKCIYWYYFLNFRWHSLHCARTNWMFSYNFNCGLFTFFIGIYTVETKGSLVKKFPSDLRKLKLNF